MSTEAERQQSKFRIRCAREIALVEYQADTRAGHYADARAVTRAELRADDTAERIADIQAEGRVIVGADDCAEKWHSCRNELQK